MLISLLTTNEPRSHIMKTTFSAVLRSFAEVILGLCFLTVSMSSSATVLTATDSSWKISSTAPATSDWSSNVTFNDSGWQGATVIAAMPPYLNGKFIWSSGGQYSTDETQVWARSVFNLSTLPLSARLDSAFDDDGDIFINGVLVVSDHNGTAGVSFADIGSYLVLGDNLIAFTATDNYPVYGYNHAAAVQIDATFEQVPEPASLALLAMGLACLGLMRRRTALVH